MKRSFWTTAVLAIIASLTVAIEPAFAATTYSFTNATATGRNGPTQAQVNTAYTSTTLAGAVTVSPQGIQSWTVPVTGKYSISIAGAGGGGNTAGKGAVLYGEFTLTQGVVLKILVGQLGTASSNYSGGGGGGSFVWNAASTTEPLIAAGGGGGDGGGTSYAGVNASTLTGGTAGTGPSSGSTYAPGAGGTNGSAGSTFDASANCWDAAAGAGWKGNSTTATQFCGTANNALSPLNGGTGGASFSVNGNNEGGFGGAAAVVVTPILFRLLALVAVDTQEAEMVLMTHLQIAVPAVAAALTTRAQILRRPLQQVSLMATSPSPLSVHP